MHVGYFVDPLHPAGSDFTKNIHDDLSQIATLDKLGFTEAWVAEHFTMAWESIPSPDLFIAQAIAMTENIKLCTGVTCLPNHNPFHLAHRIAQLDHQAKGRFMWGVGSGASPLDFKAFDIDPTPSELHDRTWQTLDMVLKIWDGLEPGTYENKFWKFTMPEAMDDLGFYVHMKPYQKPHPPIGVGGLSPRSDTLRIAGERSWIPLSVDFIPTSSLITQWEVYTEGARSGGHIPNRADWRVCRHVFIADTTEEAREIAMTGVMARDFGVYFKNVLDTLGVLDLAKTDLEIPDEDIDVEYMVDNIWIVGSAEEVAGKLRKLHHDIGGFGTLIAWSHEWEPYDKWVNSMTVLAKEVIPSLSDLTP
jgi:alkanesulfonate monooxygenase SsuD/methylene tetrahydromethanopterin reductase-like flavin-dependent oxidoreductase (luciferase family)